MSCITQLLKMKGDKEILPVHEEIVIEGGGLYKDHEYLIVFTSSGHRCGYVALLPGEHENISPDDGASFPDNIDCHGGVTFYQNSHAAKELLPIPCDDMWIGFDAAHYMDVEDMETAEKYFGETRFVKFKKENPIGRMHPNGTHKTFNYMEKSCHHIIDQLTEVAG